MAFNPRELRDNRGRWTHRGPTGVYYPELDRTLPTVHASMASPKRYRKITSGRPGTGHGRRQRRYVAKQKRTAPARLGIVRPGGGKNFTRRGPKR